MTPDEYFRAHATLGAWAAPNGSEVIAIADGRGAVRVARTGAPTVSMLWPDWRALFAGLGRRYRRVSSARCAQRSDLR